MEDFLSELQIPDNITSGAGQNKNCYVIHSMCFWLYHDAPENLDNIAVIFPVRGHSYMPADRIFGQIEKKYRKRSEIMLKEDYEEILKEVGTVRRLGEEWVLWDVKTMSDANCKKLTGISNMKRILIKKEINTKTKNKVIKVKMEENYRNDDISKQFMTIMKKGSLISCVTVDKLPLENKVKPLKLKNIETLLTLYDEDWQTIKKFAFYKNILEKSEAASSSQNHETENEDSADDEDNNNCDCLEDDCGVKL